jgi:hypothetical protein
MMEKVRQLINKKQWIKLTHLSLCFSDVAILSKYPSVNSSPLDNRAHKKTNVLSRRTSFFERLRNLGFGGNRVVMKLLLHDLHDLVAARYIRFTWRSQYKQIGPLTLVIGVVHTTVSDARISKIPESGLTLLFWKKKLLAIYRNLKQLKETWLCNYLPCQSFNVFLERRSVVITLVRMAC